MLKRNLRIKLRATIEGPIWMPNITCEKIAVAQYVMAEGVPFYQKWEGLRDALEGLIQDGDFQWCRIREAIITVTDRQINQGQRAETSITWDIRPTAFTRDLFVEEAQVAD